MMQLIGGIYDAHVKKIVLLTFHYDSLANNYEKELPISARLIFVGNLISLAPPLTPTPHEKALQT